jgi:zinc transporter 1
VSLRKRTAGDAFTFGFRRSEFLGGFANLCFLLALCLYILLESIPHLISPTPILPRDALQLIGIAGTGVAINLICTVILTCSGIAAHGGHSHSHSHADEAHEAAPLLVNNERRRLAHKHGDRSLAKMDVNVFALIVHLMGDVFSSLVVLLVGVVVYIWGAQTWTAYADPSASLLIVVIIFATTVPAFRRVVGVLMQAAPASVKPDVLTAALCGVDGVSSVHELHVWQLVDSTNIGTVHVVMIGNADVRRVCNDVRAAFHRFGIHSVTVQPELQTSSDAIRDERSLVGSGDIACQEHCVAGCEADKCC